MKICMGPCFVSLEGFGIFVFLSLGGFGMFRFGLRF